MNRFHFTFILLTFSLFLVAFPQEFRTTESKILSLIEKFSDEDPFTNGKAILELAAVGEQAVSYLLKTLQSDIDNLRWCSAIALEKIAPNGKEAIPFLTDALKDKNSNVRWCAALALGKFKDQAAVSIPNLLLLLKDNDRDVRWAAYVSLKKIDKKAINYIVDYLEIVKTLETLTPSLMRDLKIPGVSISLIKDKSIYWSKGFGFANNMLKNTVSNMTIFEACSMSKPVFTFLVLKLVEQGKFDLDKPLYSYLPEEFISDDEEYSKQITARMILTHTSSLPNWRKGGEERENPLPIYFKPGTKFSYSGEGFFYLQRVIEHVTHEPLDIYASRELFDKIGMNSTSFVWVEQLDSQIAAGHDTSGNYKQKSKYIHANSAYTLYTTSEDYARFIIELMNPANSYFSLSKELIDEMLSHQIRMDTRDVIDRPGRNLGLFSFRGLGWVVDSTITGNIVYHSGANQTGFRCYSQFNPDEGSGIVIMTNGENGNELWCKLINEAGDL